MELIHKHDKGRFALLRYTITGISFTILSSIIFWVCYPLGPLVAATINECVIHIVRYSLFRLLVFPAHKGYIVSPARYLISVLPVSISGFIIVAVFRYGLSRTMLTLTLALMSIVIGFIWSRYIYTFLPKP